MILGSLRIFFFVFLFSNFNILYADPISGYQVELKILDKITAKVKTIYIDVNNSLVFQSLNIQILSCYKRPPEEIPEDFVLLRIYDNLNNAVGSNLIYQGWMISSSPSATPLEHPIYDLWLIDCKVSKEFS